MAAAGSSVSIRTCTLIVPACLRPKSPRTDAQTSPSYERKHCPEQGARPPSATSYLFELSCVVSEDGLKSP